MDSFPIIDYAPGTLVGVFVLCVCFGVLVPWRVVKQYLAQIKFLQDENKQLRAALEEEQKTGKVVRHFFEGLNDR